MIAILGTLLYFKSALYFVGVASSLISIVGAGIALYFAYKAMSNMEAKKLTSWNNIYYGWLSAIVFGILANLTSIGNSAAFSYDYASGVPLAIATTTVVFSTLIAIAIDFLILYIIFQIKSYYKN